MKTKILLIFLLLSSLTICKSQIPDSLIIKKDTLWTCAENSIGVFSVLYEVENRSSNTYYLSIEKKLHSTEYEKIRNYFRKTGLSQMAMERNAIWRCLTIYDTFLKKIKPQERFTIQIISEERLSEYKKKQIFNYLDNHVVALNEGILRQYVVGLDNFNPLFFYKHSFITIPLNVIDFDSAQQITR